MALKIIESTKLPTLEDKKLIGRHLLLQKLKKNTALRWIKKILSNPSPIGVSSPPKKATNRKIHIIYRHVYITGDSNRFPMKGRPLGFSYKLCFQNLLETIIHSPLKDNVTVTVFYNGTLDEFKSDDSMINDYTDDLDINIQLIGGTSALESVMVMLRECRNLKIEDEDILYILENDYLHQKNWVSAVFDLFESNYSFDYASLYDHPDRYKLLQRYTGESLYLSGNRHWITARSTCGSFLTKFSTYKRDYKYIYSCKSDHQMFSRLTKRFNRVLLTPVPGLSVHCMSDHLDVVNEFEEYFIKNDG